MKMAYSKVRVCLGRAASLLLGLALLWWLLKAVDWRLIWERSQAVSTLAWCVGIGGLMVSHVLRAGRIRNEWSQRLEMRWHEAWGLLVTHSAWVVLVPLRAGEAVYVWALHQRGKVSVLEATLSLVKMRLQDIGILLCFAIFFWLPVVLAWRSFLAVFLLIVVLPCVFPWVWRMASRRWAAKASPLQAANETHQHAAPHPSPIKHPPSVHVNWTSWFYAVSNWAVKLLSIAWPLSELGGLEIHIALAAALGGEWGAAMPFQPPAGLGPYEAGAWAGAHWAHPSDSWAYPLGEAPLPVNLPAAFLVVHLMALAVTVISAITARILGWSQQPFSGIDQA